MKKIILLVFVTLFCCVGYSQAQKTKKMTRQEKKEAQKAMEQALFEEARQAIENKAFTLEADRVIFKRGRNAFVSSNTNFVMVDGDKSSVQVAFNIPASGPNGLGGVTVDGNVSGYKIKTDISDNERNGCRYICSGKYNITLWKQQCHRRYTPQLQFQPSDFIR